MSINYLLSETRSFFNILKSVKTRLSCLYGETFAGMKRPKNNETMYNEDHSVR